MSKEHILALLDELQAALADSKNVSKGQYAEGVEELLARAKEETQAYREEEDDDLKLDATEADAREYIDGLDDAGRSAFFAHYELGGTADLGGLERGESLERFADDQAVIDYLTNLGEADREQLLAGFRAPSNPGDKSAEGEADFWAVGNATFTYKEDAERYIRRNGMSGGVRPLVYKR